MQEYTISFFEDKIINLETRILKMQESLEQLQMQYWENRQVLDKVLGLSGKKRKRWQMS
jgi:hypothetical protein